ncbi:MAG: hypothetical protein HYZ75_09815 [Elusimicrobia bacterium]|nr:hypothetical protein [Elusimicrobiota bacterium]
MEPRGKLVGSGSFRVDRSRALEKLMRFQLPDARMYPLPWVQAAVASRAGWIRVVPQPAGLEFSFDGLPWSLEDLADPYKPLFDEDVDGSKTRQRELAIGILTALRVPPEHVTATFTHEDAQYVLHMSDITKEHIEPAASYDSKAPAMTLFVSVKTSFAKERDFLVRLAKRCPIPITIQRSRLELGPEPPAVLAESFHKDGVSGVLRLPDYAPEQSRVELVTHGVIVAEEWLRLPGAQVEGWVRNDGFRKTLSQMGVVKDNFYHQASGVLVEHSQALLKRAAARAWELSRACAEALADEGLRLSWMPWETANLSERLGALIAPRPGEASEKAAALREQSVLVSTLRQACLHRKADIEAEKAGDGLPALLSEAPILYDALGRPLALRPLLAQARWLGHVPTVDNRHASPPGPLTSAWVVREADRRFLEAFFPDRVRTLRARDMAPLDSAARPVLDDSSLLVRLPFMSGPVSGEAGLSISPHTRRSRLRWIGSPGPLGASAWEMRGLRIEAALFHPQLVAAPREGAPSDHARSALAALLGAAPALYQLLAREYVPDQDTPRMAVIREHLMDLMRLSCDHKRLDTVGVPWLAGLPLLLDRQGRRLSLEDLRARAAVGKKTLLRASIHPERLAPLVDGYPDHVRLLFGDSEFVELAGEVPPTPKPDVGLALPKTKRVELPPAPDEALHPPKTARLEPAYQPPEELVVDPGGELRSWLSVLKRRGGCQLPDAALQSLKVTAHGAGAFLRFMPESGWELDAAHPVALPLVDLSPADSVPYLASLAHSGLNRALSGVTDTQDALFIEALAALTLERYGG